MGKSFLADAVNQTLLFPPWLHDWLPEGHLARFPVDVVAALDLSAIYASYDEKDGRGQSAYAPEMMLRVLLYGYATGVYSSRKIEARTYEEVAFRYLSADQHPDHDTIAEFRKRHLEALAGLFTQALLLCEKAGLVNLGHVSIEGTKIKANASQHKAMSYGRMGETEARLKEEIEALLKQAEATDAAEDAQYGKGRRGDELPEELRRGESRLKKIAEAKAELEREAREKAEQERAEAEAKLAARREQEERTGKKKGGRKPQVPDPEQAQPDAKAQRNFTDPDSRIMPDGANKGSFVQGYNAQAAVDATAQVIVAAEVTQDTTDNHQLLPMLDQVEENLGRKQPAPMPVISAKPTLPMRAWRRSICTLPPDGISTRKSLLRRVGRRRKPSRQSRPCATSCAPRQDGAFTRCARPSSSRSSARSKKYAASGASACAA